MVVSTAVNLYVYGLMSFTKNGAERLFVCSYYEIQFLLCIWLPHSNKFPISYSPMQTGNSGLQLKSGLFITTSDLQHFLLWDLTQCNNFTGTVFPFTFGGGKMFFFLTLLSVLIG